MIQKISGFDKFNGLKAKAPRVKVLYFTCTYSVICGKAPGLGFKPRPFDPQARTLTNRPPHLLTWEMKIW